MKKYTNIIIVGLFFISVLCTFSLAEEESYTITTYYPSPYGVYKELRLYPNTSPNPCDNNNKGAMYYNDSDSQVYVCNGTAWKTLGSGCPDVPGANQSNCWLDVDGDGFSPKTGDCDETCAKCYNGSNVSTSSPDGHDQNCNGIIDESGGTDIIVHETTGQTCVQRCAAIHGSSSTCVSTGSDPAASNNKFWWFSGGHCSEGPQQQPGHLCTWILGDWGPKTLCNGHYATWLYCKCTVGYR